MLFSKSLPLTLGICGTCAGIGIVGRRKCRECRGKSVGLFWQEILLYFYFPVTHYHIRLRQGRVWLHRFQMIGAIIFGVGMLLLFAYEVYRMDAVKEIGTLSFWIESRTYVPVLFSMSLIFFSYLLYRLITTGKPRARIVPDDWNTISGGDAEHTHQSFRWAHAARISSKKSREISRVFTRDALRALEEAYELARARHEEEVSIIHIFHALLSSADVRMIFLRLGFPALSLQARIEQLFDNKEKTPSPVFSGDVFQVVFHSYILACEKKEEHVHVTDMLVASVFHSESIQEFLYDLNIDKQKLENVVEWARIRERLRNQYKKLRHAASRRSKYGIDRAMTAVATPYLNQFSDDLTMMAKYGHLAPAVARSKETDEVFRVIESGRQSVVLIGDHGVGKMSIVEGIAQRMIEDDVPARLKDKRLVRISTSSLLAGTTVSGAQERLIRMMQEVGRAGNIILFFNNIHDLVSIATGQGEGLDVSETLAEYLGPGKFLTLATTTEEGYTRHIVHSEVGTVLAPIHIEEMTEDQAIQVLESKVGVIEYRQKVFFSYDALAVAVKLSKQLLHDQRLPESAIETLSESAIFARNAKGQHHLVTGEDVAAIISNKTGVPTETITEDEGKKLLRLEEEMHARVIGQAEAVVLVANALRRARAEIRSKNRPIANFLFLGPTGTGKTELAKTIASVYFGGEERMIRVDMSEYQDKTSIYRLIGAPGQQGTGLLTEAVRAHPFSLVLLDELEKADPHVINLFLQVFDDGRLTDSVGRAIDFTNTIIIATSNAGTSYVQDQIRMGVALEIIRQALMRNELTQWYRPEFLNRFDGIVLFRPLEREQIKKIASLMLSRVGKELDARGVELRVKDSALDALADVGFDPEFGARPMRRAIQDRVENILADLIISGKLQRRDVVIVGDGAHISVQRI